MSTLAQASRHARSARCCSARRRRAARCRSRARRSRMTIRASGKGVERACAVSPLRFDAIRRQHERREAALLAAEALDASPPPLDERCGGAFRRRCIAMLALGHARVAEYQDEAYAAAVRRTLAARARRRARSRRRRWLARSREAARWLALWMAFDDVVRVAQLKLARRALGARAPRGRGARRRDRQAVRPLQARRAGVRCVCCPRASPRGSPRWDTRRRARGQRALGAAAEARRRTPSSAL